MNQTKTIKELYVLRSIACLSVVFLHAIGIGLSSIPTSQISHTAYVFFDSLNMLLYFSTPVFIFISEFLLAYSYRKKSIPTNFLKKRAKFLLLPFLFMAFFYAIPYATPLSEGVKKFLLNAVIGDYHGYFVLIIFQFYFLHLLSHKLLKKINPKICLSISLFINVAYLSFFHFIEPLNIPFNNYIWERFYWIPFFGWIFYFTLGFYCGHYYELFIKLLVKYKVIILSAPLFTSALLLFFYHSNILMVHSSKRVDILLHATFVIFFIYYIAYQMKKIPTIFLTISKYSFGIYLLHFFFILAFDYFYRFFSINLGILYIFILFFFSTCSSMGTMFYVNKWKFGNCLVGQLPQKVKEQNQDIKASNL